MKPFNRGNILNYFSVSVKKAIQYRASLLLDLQNLSKQYEIKDFSVLKKLGEGQFGQVFLVVNNRTNKIYALKCVSKIETLKYKLERHLVVIRYLFRTKKKSWNLIVALSQSISYDLLMTKTTFIFLCSLLTESNCLMPCV